MEKGREGAPNCGRRFADLLHKIARIRRRLLSCGYSVQELIDIIFLQFLGLPEIDWKDIEQTTHFYETKTTYKADSATTEVIMRLQKIVPDLHTEEVCEYLLSVLELNAADLGFNLEESSSDSNDSCSGMRRLIIRKQKKPAKNAPRKKPEEGGDRLAR
jgi:hypothetical protein